MARQEQQQRRNSKSSSSSSISGRQHQQRGAAAASVLHCYGVSLSGTHVFAAASRQPVLYSTIYSLRFSRMYSLGFSRISEDTLGTFLLRFCAIFGTKLGGVLLFRANFEKDVWLLVSRLGGWLMARQEQQQRRNSKSSSSSSSGRQHQQRAAAAAAVFVLHCYGVSLSGTHVFAAASRQPVLYSTIYSLRFSRMYSLGFSRIL